MKNQHKPTLTPIALTDGDKVRRRLARIAAKLTVADGGCWEWQGLRDRYGYGSVTFQGRRLGVHRLVFLLCVDAAIVNATHVLHRCDNPRCVNPAHLFAGTHADNMRDCKLKGRTRGPGDGEKNHRSKLTDRQVAEIRQEWETLADLTLAAKRRFLASRFNVSPACVRGIITGRRRVAHA